MKNLTLKKAFLRGAALAMSQKDGAVTRRVNFTMAWNNAVRNALGWHETSEEQETVSLAGELAVHEMKFAVGGYEYDFGSGMFNKFSVHRLDDGKKVSYELRGQYSTMTLGVMKHIEDCAEKYARIKGDLMLKYEFSEPEKKPAGDDGGQGELIDMSENR